MLTNPISTIRIALFNHSLHSGNLGIGAISISNIIILDDLCKQAGIEARFTIFSGQGTMDYSSSLVGVNVEFQELPRYRSIIKYAKKMHEIIDIYDLFIDSCGGDSYSDIYGSVRFLINFLPKYYILKSGKPLVFSPQTIGPFKNRYLERLAMGQLKKARLVFPRDALSADYLRERINFGNLNIFLSTDVAMSLPYFPAYKRSEIGVNISGLLYNEGYNGRNQFGLKCEYSQLVGRLIDELHEKFGNDYKIVLVPHVFGRNKTEDDYHACMRLIETRSFLSCAPCFKSPIEAKSYISGFKLFIGSRMHATIAALSSGVPTIPLGYSRKFFGFFSNLGYMHSIDLTELTSDNVVDDVQIKISALNTLQINVDESNKHGSELLMVYKGLMMNIIKEIHFVKD